jgi:hypothetical protein
MATPALSPRAPPVADLRERKQAMGTNVDGAWRLVTASPLSLGTLSPLSSSGVGVSPSGMRSSRW